MAAPRVVQVHDENKCCKHCQEEVQRLIEENQRLLRALHRESHHIDKRTPHTGPRPPQR